MEDRDKKIIEAALEIMTYISNPEIIEGEVKKIIKLASGLEK